MGQRLSEYGDTTTLSGSKSGRMLAMIRRDMDLKDSLMRRRRRNEEILSLTYVDGTMTGSAENQATPDELARNATNLPYRYVRWLESQATSKKMVVSINRDAGEGQLPGGPSDAKIGMWRAKCLERVAYEAGFQRETKALIGEVCPRGTSVMAIGYHEEVVSQADVAEVGKDAQSIAPEVLGAANQAVSQLSATGPTLPPDPNALEAKPGQAHGEIISGLTAMAQDPMVQMTAGTAGVNALLARAESHNQAQLKEETKVIPKQSTRLTRHKIWMKKERVGENVGWHPAVQDIADTDRWWHRLVWTVAEVKASSLFTPSFKKKVKGYDAPNVSGVARGGQTPSTQSMGPDARQAQSEDVLDDNERMVEFFLVYCRRPQLRSGGVRKIVCAECPDEFIEADEANPFVYPAGHPLEGYNTIPGFFPFYDFTPVLGPLAVPERTCGVPLIAVGMPHFEKLTEYNRLLRESGLRHSLRLYQIHPALKDNKKLADALRNGEDGFAFVADQAMVDSTGNMKAQGVIPIQFSGNTMEVDRLANREQSAWVMVMGMPPAVLQGVGTANTAAQDNMGLAAGERESGAVVEYFEDRMADVLGGLQGLMRSCYDDEDFQRLLGQEGAAAMKDWQTGTIDDGDRIEVAFGATAQAERTVRTKQVMEAINLLAAQVDPVTGLPKYDYESLLDELMRLLDVGGLKLDPSVLQQLQQLAMVGKQALMAAQAAQQGATGGAPGASAGAAPTNGKPPRAGPNPSEGAGPQEGTLAAGARRGTLEPVGG